MVANQTFLKYHVNIKIPCYTTTKKHLRLIGFYKMQFARLKGEIKRLW